MSEVYSARVFIELANRLSASGESIEEMYGKSVGRFQCNRKFSLKKKDNNKIIPQKQQIQQQQQSRE